MAPRTKNQPKPLADTTDQGLFPINEQGDQAFFGETRDLTQEAKKIDFAALGIATKASAQEHTIAHGSGATDDPQSGDQTPKGMFSVNLANIKQGFENIPDGDYVATIVAAQPGYTEAGDPKIDIRWKIQEHVDPERNGHDYDNRIVFDGLYFMPAAMWRVGEFLIGIGYPEDYSGELDPEALIGDVAIIRVGMSKPSTKIDKATGKPYTPRNAVKKVLPITARKQSVAQLIDED